MTEIDPNDPGRVVVVGYVLITANGLYEADLEGVLWRAASLHSVK